MYLPSWQRSRFVTWLCSPFTHFGAVNASRLFAKRLAPLPLRCLRFAPRFLAESVRAARSVAVVCRNPSGSVLWQGQVNASHPCQRSAPCLASFRSCLGPLFSPPILWALSRPCSFKRGRRGSPPGSRSSLSSPLRGLRAWRASEPAPSRLPALRGVGWSPT